MMEVVRRAPEERQAALLRAHPELAGREPQEGTLTSDSTSEQAHLGFNALAQAELARMAELNKRYREKFGFPAIIALRRHETRHTVLAEQERRLEGQARRHHRALSGVLIVTTVALMILVERLTGLSRRLT